jgi:DNA-3-methyladenine glycosylase II
MAGEAARFELTPLGPFSLAASARFLEGFVPAAREEVGNEAGHLHLAFAVEGGWETVGVCLREEGGVVVGEVFGGAPIEAVRAQVGRILSLDVDGRGFPGVGERDPVVGRLQGRYGGLRPVGFYSPYEAGAWALIGHRMRIVQAARVKARMAEELGEEVVVHGERLHAFPAPGRLRELDTFSGLSTAKVENLRGLAEAALAGRLDGGRLRAMPAEEALAELRGLRGIGPFSAELILLRGAGHPDLLAANEPRLRRAVAMAYALDHEPDPDELVRISEGWRPYRTWVALLLRTMLEDETREILGRSA